MSQTTSHRQDIIGGEFDVLKGFAHAFHIEKTLADDHVVCPFRLCGNILLPQPATEMPV